MRRNGINVALRQQYSPIGIINELHFQGSVLGFKAYLGYIRVPICSRQQMEKLINVLTKEVNYIWNQNPPKQSH